MAPNNNNNNNITKEDLIGLHHVNVNALLRNFLKYGQGNYNTSPNIRSKRLNDFPKLDMINKSSKYALANSSPCINSFIFS